MALADEFRRAMEDADLGRLRGLWAQASPHLPQPSSDAEALIVMHRARTEAASVTPAKRFYSHRWLEERGLPSGLPDRLKPLAERMYPRVVEAVGIAVKFSSPLLKPAGKLIERAMSDAVADAYAEGRTDPAFVTARMQAARADETRRLFGSLIPAP